jgi:hypothetical protein
MTDRRNVKFEIVEHRGALQKIPHHLDSVKINRWRTTVVVTAMAITVLLGFVFSPDDSLKTAVPSTKVADTNLAVSSDINLLKGQFVGLISGSIESKLKTLEDNIRMGSINNSLGTIQDLKNDVKVLRAYSPDTPENTRVSNAELMQEVSHLRNLIYLTLSSCGLMIAAVAGIWFKNRKRLPFQEEDITRYLGK